MYMLEAVDREQLSSPPVWKGQLPHRRHDLEVPRPAVHVDVDVAGLRAVSAAEFDPPAGLRLEVVESSGAAERRRQHRDGLRPPIVAVIAPTKRAQRPVREAAQRPLEPA
jgi:hypothetical protein